jgi:hypothetical protein
MIVGALCSLEELHEHVRYLLMTPVAWIAADLALGRATLSHAVIETASELGGTQTIFRNLGGVTVGGRYFRIDEGFAAFHDPRSTDADGRRLVDHYLGILRRDESLELRITCRADGDGITRIYDGNKRCIALYEREREQARPQLMLPVLLVRPVVGG